jgi:hypothetical protein
MSIFNEPIHPFIITQLGRRQNLMGQNERTTTELAYLNSNNSWIKLQSSVDIDGSMEPARQNVLLGGTLQYFDELSGGKQVTGYRRKYGISPAGDTLFLDNTISQYGIEDYAGRDYNLGLRPMAGITSLKIDSVGAYGSIRKATVNFQCWDIKQLEILEALYMRVGFTVLLEYGRNQFIDVNGKLQQVKLENNFLDGNSRNIKSYSEKLYQKSLSQGGHYDGFFGYIHNYKWSYRNDGGYDCMTEIISTGEIAESIKMNHALSGRVTYTGFGRGNTKQTKTAPFKGLILPKQVSNIASEDIIRLNNEYSENILSGLMYELYTIINYEYTSGSYDPTPGRQVNLKIPKRDGDGIIDLNWSFMQYTSTSDPTSNDKDEKLLDGAKNYFITLDSLCNIITEYNLPYSYDGDFKTRTGNLTSVSTKSRIYTDILKPSEPLLCLYNKLMISTNPDVCWINADEWINIAKGAQIEIDKPPTPLNSSRNPYISADYTPRLRQKIVKWLNTIFYQDLSSRDEPLRGIVPRISGDDIMAEIDEEQKWAERLQVPYNNNQLDLPNFSPLSQDLIAIQQIRERGALQDIEKGYINIAIDKVKNIWASLPGAGYGQHENTLDKLITAYKDAGGTIA